MSDHPQTGYRSHYRTLLGGTTALPNWTIGRCQRTVRLRAVLSRIAPVILGLVALDELLHPDRVCLAMPMAFDRAGAAGGLNIDVRKHEVRVDAHRRDVRHVHRMLKAAEPLGCVVNDARWRNRDLRRKQPIARAQTARAEDIAFRKWPPFFPDDKQHNQRDRAERRGRPHEARIDGYLVHGM